MISPRSLLIPQCRRRERSFRRILRSASLFSSKRRRRSLLNPSRELSFSPAAGPRVLSPASFPSCPRSSGAGPGGGSISSSALSSDFSASRFSGEKPVRSSLAMGRGESDASEEEQGLSSLSFSALSGEGPGHCSPLSGRGVSDASEEERELFSVPSPDLPSDFSRGKSVRSSLAVGRGESDASGEGPGRGISDRDSSRLSSPLSSRVKRNSFA